MTLQLPLQVQFRAVGHFGQAADRGGRRPPRSPEGPRPAAPQPTCPKCGREVVRLSNPDRLLCGYCWLTLPMAAAVAAATVDPPRS